MVKRLIESRRVAGDAPTVTGRTLAEEAATATETPGQEVVRPIDRPLKPTGGLVIPLRQPRSRRRRPEALGHRARTAIAGRRACSTARRPRSRRFRSSASNRVTWW